MQFNTETTPTQETKEQEDTHPSTDTPQQPINTKFMMGPHPQIKAQRKFFN